MSDEPTISLSFDTLWHEVFSYLDAKGLLAASETCTKFEEIVSSSTKLLSKLKVTLTFPEIDTDDEVARIEARLKNHSQLTRRYQHLVIYRVRDGNFNRNREMKNNFWSLIANLSKSVKVLKIDNCHILRQDLISLLRPFALIRDCSVTNLMLFDDVGLAGSDNVNVSWPNLKRLKLKRCDFFCLMLLKSCKKLEDVEISDPAYNRPDIEQLENFLLKQAVLKRLKLRNFRFNSTYSTNRLGSPSFQLEYLSLHNTNWDLSDHCEVFLKSQHNLKKLELKTLRQWSMEVNYQSFSGIMFHLLALNVKLVSLTIDTRFSSFQNIKDAEFLLGFVNNSVAELNYWKDGEEKSEFLKIFTRIFPKLKKLSFSNNGNDSMELLQQISLFKELELLELRVNSMSLIGFKIGSKELKTFKFYGANEEKSIEKLREIFQQNLTIKHIVLNIEPLTIEEIIEMLIGLASSLETLNISDMHLNKAEAELVIASFPRMRRIVSDCPLRSPDVLEILSAANIQFTAVKEHFMFKSEDF